MKNILEHICKGYYSDPPDVALYFVVGKDNNSLLLYRCCHGTNDVEGGVHQNLIHRFTSFSVSPHHAVNMTIGVCGNPQHAGKWYSGRVRPRLIEATLLLTHSLTQT